MTPHYPDYYLKGKPPTDWQSPNPIKFLTVKKTKFRFYLAIKRDNAEDESILNVALEYLKGALTKHGIGAKTAIGYGYFKNL